MKLLKCLAISNSYPPDHAGGYELGTRNLLNALATHTGWQNTVVSSVRKRNPQGVDSPVLTGFFPGILGPGIELKNTRHTLLGSHNEIVGALRSKAACADIVLIFNPRRLIYPQWISVLDCGKPAFLFVSDYWPLNPIESDLFFMKSAKLQDGQLKDAKLRAIYDSVLSRPNPMAGIRGALFVSGYLKNAHSTSLSFIENQAVTPWGIDTDLFRPVPFSADRLKVFGFAGRPDVNKGLELALKAFRIVAEKTEGVRMLIASDLGANSFGRSMRKWILSDLVLKRSVVQLGHLDHVALQAKFFSQIGILLFPSVWQEPFSLTVLEAMASGALVLASSTGGTPEVVDAKTGWLFDPDSEDGLVNVCLEALKAGVANRARVERGIQRILESHTMPQMAEKVDSFVRGAIHLHSSTGSVRP